MDLANHNFWEACVPVQMILPGTQLDGGVTAGLWVSTRDFYKIPIQIETTGGTTGDDLVISILQATSNAGAGSKAFAGVTAWYMAQAATLGQSTSMVYTQTKPATTPASSFTATGSAGKQSIIGFEIIPDYLDATDGFYFVSFTIATTADSALGTAYAFPFTRHPQGGVGGLPVSPLQ